MASKKNRREKGDRAEVLGSNPHSNGEDFSRSFAVFFEIVDETSIIINDKMLVATIIVGILNICYIFFLIGN